MTITFSDIESYNKVVKELKVFETLGFSAPLLFSVPDNWQEEEDKKLQKWIDEHHVSLGGSLK